MMHAKMKAPWLSSLWMVWLLLATPSMAAAVEPGLYEQGQKGDEMKPFQGRVIRTELRSLSNDNTRCNFTVTYEGEYEGWAGVKTRDRVFQAHAQKSQGEMPRFTTVIEGAEAIREVTERFKPVVMLRQHPGYRMRVEYFQKSRTLEAGKPFLVAVRITNVGDAPFTFMQGGRQRGYRDNQFAFSAMEDFQKMLPDTGSPTHMGGLGGWITVKPQASHEIEVDLTRWFALRKGAFYRVRGSYAMEFCESGGMHTLWEDFATAEFSVKVDE